jgi:orotidine-5'-phosphate decarboxylase
MVALDVPDMDQAMSLKDQLGETVGWFKVGLQLFVSCGPELVHRLGKSHRIFLDLKFHDIPNTVAQAVKSAAELGVQMLNVHAAGGEEMLRAAAKAASSYPQLRLIAVTVLTSEKLSHKEAEALALKRAVMAKRAGMHGVVCSAHEVASIKQACGGEFLAVTPGIRWADQSTHDQQRVATPAMAIRNGADYLVIGRPILRARDPLATTRQALEEMKRAHERT